MENERKKVQQHTHFVCPGLFVCAKNGNIFGIRFLVAWESPRVSELLSLTKQELLLLQFRKKKTNKKKKRERGRRQIRRKKRKRKETKWKN